MVYITNFNTPKKYQNALNVQIGSGVMPTKIDKEKELKEKNTIIIDVPENKFIKPSEKTFKINNLPSDMASKQKANRFINFQFK
jgi:hypothetical protein